MEVVKAKMEVENVATTMNKNMPMKVDEQTIATKVEYLERENKLIFYYELIELTKGEKTNKEIESILQNLKNAQLNFVKNNPNNSAYIKARVIFEYIYIDKNGAVFCSYRIEPNEYS